MKVFQSFDPFLTSISYYGMSQQEAGVEVKMEEEELYDWMNHQPNVSQPNTAELIQGQTLHPYPSYSLEVGLPLSHESESFYDCKQIHTSRQTIVNEGFNDAYTLPPGESSYSGSNMGLYGHTQPYIDIIEQPMDTLRFRYTCENKTSHGKLKGVSKSKNSFPTIKLENYRPSSGQKLYAKASLCTNEDVPRRHLHAFIGKTCTDGTCEVEFDCNNIAEFKELILQYHKKEECIRICYEQLLAQYSTIPVASPRTASEDGIMAEAKQIASQIDPHVVRICFEAYYYQNGVAVPVCEKQFSNPIFHKNSNKCGSLKVARISCLEGPADGGTEVFVLCDKIDKKSIGVRLYEEKDGTVIWEADGDFNKDIDVWHNVAIVFKTPPYRNPNIKESVRVNLELYRTTDYASSDSIDFWYHPMRVI